MKTLKKSAWGFYLGMAPGFLYGSSFSDWKWWVLIIPTITLVVISEREKN